MNRFAQSIIQSITAMEMKMKMEIIWEVDEGEERGGVARPDVISKVCQNIE